MNMKFWVNIPVFILIFSSVVSCQNGVNNPTAPAQEPAQSGAYTAENEGWLVNVEEAYAISKKTGKPILANFTGSDWCGWCKRLTASVFIQDEFKKWAADNVVLLELDFPRKKVLPAEIQQQNAGMQQAFQVRGYPTVWVFHLDRNVETNQFNVNALGSTGYKATPEEFITDVKKMMGK